MLDPSLDASDLSDMLSATCQRLREAPTEADATLVQMLVAKLGRGSVEFAHDGTMMVLPPYYGQPIIAAPFA